MPGINGFEMLARMGFAARALTYGAIGYLALLLGRAEDNRGALEYIEGIGGVVLVALMAIGFLGYGLWRLSEAIANTEGLGNGAKAVVERIGGAVSGVIHLFLCWVAVRLAAGIEIAATDPAEQGASTALMLPGGGWMLIAVAMVLFGVGAYQGVKAYRLCFLRFLDPAVADKPWIAWLGRAGYLARGLVFAMTGLFMLEAGKQENAQAAGGFGQALDRLPDDLQFLCAAGLFMFGLFSAVEARYRRINDSKVLDRLRAHAIGR